MAQVITIAGERLFALKAQNNEQLDVDTFIFANVPGQDPTTPIDRNEGLPSVGQIVHQQIVQQVGRVNDNVVIYSTVMDSLTGPFDFNWVGLYSSVNQTLIAVSHIPSVSKTITVPGAAGNTLNRNFGIEYSGIADLTGITVAPETWQLDFTARLSGMDELTRQLAADMNGKDWFIDDGFKVVPRSTANTFNVTAGAGYVSGLRVELKQDHILTLQSYPQFVYVDAWFDGDASSQWKPKTAFTVTNGEMDDYIDVNGKQHYVFKLAIITAADSVEDLRSIDGLRQEVDRISDVNLTFSTTSAMIANVEKNGFKSGQLAKVQGENNLTVFYSIVNDESDIDLGNGLYAKRLSITRNDDIRLFGGSVKADDNSLAFLAAKARNGKVFFPADGNNTYIFTTWDVGFLSNTEIFADPGITLVFPDDVYAKFDSGTISSDINVKFLNINITSKEKKYNNDGVKDSVSPISAPRVDINTVIPFSKLKARQVAWPDDIFTQATMIDVNGYQAAFMGLSGYFAGIFTDIRVGETITSTITNNSIPTNRIGVMVRGSNGFITIYKTPTLTSDYLTVAIKLNGQALIEESIDYELRGVLTSFEIANSEISITLLNPLEFAFSLNGCVISKFKFGGIGTIYEIGFVSYADGGNQSDCTISTPVCQYQQYAIGMPPIRELIIFGDSTADEFFGSFTQYLPQVMDAQMGIKLEKVTNLAVAGSTLENMLAVMQSPYGFGDAYHVLVVGATNNIQAGQPLSDFANIFQTVLNEITSAGCKPVVVEPYMWYPKIAAGGNGQNTNNYDGGSKHRAFMQLATIQAGGVYIRTTQELPNPLPRYINSQPDPLLRDNIHQTVLTRQMYATMIGNSIFADYTKISNSWSFMPSTLAGEGIDISQSLYRANKDNTTTFNITASFVAGLANGSILFTLPRWVDVNTRNIPVITLNNTTFTAASAFANIGHDFLLMQLNAYLSLLSNINGMINVNYKRN